MYVQYRCVFAILSIVSAIMTVVNFFTNQTMLMYATLIFAVLCGIDYVIAHFWKRHLQLAVWLFVAEIFALFLFFIISGEPQGFATIWCALLPASGLLLFRRKTGTILCLGMLLVLIFFFWTPIGRGLLWYNYTGAFMLRFPFLYLAFLAVGLFLETIRSITFDKYLYTSQHDPLTGALNRAGFKTHIEAQFSKSTGTHVGFAIFDLDHFKRVNDTYGHFAGDGVLKETCRRLEALSGLPICRWGGEEFALIDPEGKLDQAWADAVIAGFSAEPFIINEAPIRITISLGAVTADGLGDISTDKLCLEADKCLYEAKESGRNRAVYREIES